MACLQSRSENEGLRDDPSMRWRALLLPSLGELGQNQQEGLQRPSVDFSVTHSGASAAEMCLLTAEGQGVRCLISTKASGEQRVVFSLRQHHLPSRCTGLGAGLARQVVVTIDISVGWRQGLVGWS